ncbi:hypothetical protein PV10_01745 [Exophiala mesophila]|uniref:Uncharacterized protein n=1 Tax=Exophiala mesophila TaxID=212818 RepID=A0A0D1ZVP8_EXOME|nr:uncharacterized protein PV10_01745 [Exophiala mesophila]KIV98054.1 hypothetical protein PV10_01745 [Exophiala mesophila]
MVSWRDRGYVPDSDDEEDEVAITESDEQRHHKSQSDSPKTSLPKSRNELERTDQVDPDNVGPSFPLETVESSNQRSLGIEVENDFSSESNRPSKHKTNSDQSGKTNAILQSPSTTASLLEAELNKGLQVVQEVIGLQNFEDDSDSPLSSPPSSISSPPKQPNVSIVLPSFSLDRDDGFSSLSTQSLELAAARRSLRARAPIQLHPYALEAAQYQRDWKSRGLRPLRYMQPSGDNEPQLATGEESQETETFQGSESLEIPPQVLSSSPIQLGEEDESQSPISGRRNVRPRLPDFDLGAELPDLADLLKNDTRNLAKQLQRPKKAKARKPNLQSQPVPNGYQVFDLPSDGEEPSVRPKIPRRPLQIPPSPPRSRGGLSSPGDVAPGDEFNEAGRSPSLLPSPFLSSDKPNRKRPQPDSLETSEVEVVVVNDASSESTGSSTDSDERPPKSVRMFQRRIKGVLPASWLKLDRQQQKGKTTISEQPRSLEKGGIERGIAQRLPSSSLARATQHSTRPVFDDSQLDTSEDDDSSQSVEIVDETPWGIAPDLVLDDIMEDNSIDHMLPPRTRSQYGPHRQGGETKKKRQQQIPGVWQSHDIDTRERSSRYQPDKVSNGAKGRLKNSSSTTGSRKKQKMVQKQAQLSLLDAPGFSEHIVPRYLKIAARSGKRTSRQSHTQDSTKKFFKLATVQDTHDVNRAMRGWKTLHGKKYAVATPRDGTLVRAAPAQRQQSSSIGVTDGSNDNTELVSLKQLTTQTLKRVYQHQKQSIEARRSIQAATRRPVLRDYFRPRPGSHSEESTIRDRPRSISNPLGVRPALTSKATLPRLVTRAPGAQPVQSLAAHQIASNHDSAKATKRQPRQVNSWSPFNESLLTLV